MRLPPATHRLLGFAGPRREAEEITEAVGRFLHDDLKLELSPSTTLITHATRRAARFLGYEIIVQHSRDRPTVNGGIRLRAPGSDQGQVRPLSQARKTPSAAPS